MACAKMPKAIGRPLSAFWDFTFTGPLTPRRSLVFLQDASRAAKARLKNFLRRRMPGTYLKLRNRKLKNIK